MSRSALWRQEGAKKMREKEAEELFAFALNEGRNNPSKSLKLWGPDDSFHLNPVLLEKIIKSSYFQKCCRDISNWNTLVDEVYYNVKHLEPWDVGGEPSTAFCLLLRLMTLRCTEKQMKLLLDHVDSPYIRGIGLLYLRFVGDPNTILQWIEPYLSDDERITVTATSKKSNAPRRHRQQNETVGGFARRLFSSSERDYYGTALPRLPTKVEREIQVKIVFADQIEQRAKKHILNYKTMDYFQTLGNRIMALYGDDDNPIQWYEGVVDRVVTRDEESSLQLKIPKFVVTFPEYGNTETVSLGEMEMRGASLESVRKEQSSARDGKYNNTTTQREKGYSNRDGRSNYNQRRYSKNDSRYKTNHGEKDYHQKKHRERTNAMDRGNQSVARRSPSSSSSHTARTPATADPSLNSTRGKRSANDYIAHEEKKRKLMAKYG